MVSKKLTVKINHCRECPNGHKYQEREHGVFYSAIYCKVLRRNVMDMKTHPDAGIPNDCPLEDY